MTAARVELVGGDLPGRNGALLAVVALSAAVTGVVVAVSASTLTLAPELTWPLPWLLLHVGVVLLLLTASWVTLRTAPLAATGLAVLGVGLVLPVLAGVAGVPPTLRAAVVASAVLTVAGAAVLVPGLARGGVGPRARVAVGLALAAGAVHHLTVDLGDEPACLRLCLGVDPVLSLPGSRTGLGLAVVLLAASLVLTAVTAVRALLPTGERLAVVVGLVLLVAPWSTRWAAWDDGSVVLPAHHVGTVGAGVLAVVTVAHEARWRRRIATLAADLEVLRHGGHDVQLARPGTGEWLTPEGRPAPEVPGTTYVEVREAGRPVARWPERDRRIALSPAVRLGLVNAQLAAAASAELHDLRESQRRVVAASDAERTRIERDLHDGVQQRLVGALLTLSARDPELDDARARAADHLREALAGLRSLTAGLVNPVLVSDGLWAALEELADASSVQPDLEITGAEPEEEGVCRTAYLVVEAALRLLGQGTHPVRVHGAARDAALTMCVSSDGWGDVDPDALVDVADRVGAAGGSFVLDTARGRLEVVLPCGC